MAQGERSTFSFVNKDHFIDISCNYLSVLGPTKKHDSNKLLKSWCFQPSFSFSLKPASPGRPLQVKSWWHRVGLAILGNLMPCMLCMEPEELSSSFHRYLDGALSFPVSLLILFLGNKEFLTLYFIGDGVAVGFLRVSTHSQVKRYYQPGRSY